MVVVYDVETLKSCFTYSAINVETNEIYQYVLHKDRDDRIALFDHLKECIGQVGFNNINFDYIIIHYFIEEAFYYSPVEELILNLYHKAQEIIEAQDKDTFYKTIAIPTKQWKIHQLDLFKLWHYNNKARSTSLKALEISMNYPNVMEMPIEHTKDNITIEEVDDILAYNLNDVLATYEFYKRSRDKIDLRKYLESQFKIPCINFSDSKIGEQLILKLYSDKSNISPWDLKEMRTFRNTGIYLKECILNKINFTNKCFNDLLDYFKNKIIYNTKGSIEKSVIYKGFKYVYGTGGIHGCIKAGLYESDDYYIIIDADVGSLYPNLALTNNFYIEHLRKYFLDIYKSIIIMRMEAKNNGNNVLSDGLKLSANSVYGKSNDINSFLYDPKFTMQITLNGQLMLTKLAEMFVDTLNDCTILQINTDGITIKIPRNQIDTYYELCKQWEEWSKLNLEFAEYNKMWISDVNNYGAISAFGKIKNKGRFEVDKYVGSERAYHKDNSFRIIPLAIQEYFINNISIEETIRNHNNIYDFCGRQKFGRDSYGQIHYLENKKEITVRQQKNTRYYISTNGASFIKYYNKGTTECINKGYLVTIFNNYYKKNIKEYNINYSFYIKEAMKEINNIENKQLTLF